ncbi:MAG: hypothetical protein ACR2QU_03685 [Gammaproteobacteria bacterium]
MPQRPDFPAGKTIHFILPDDGTDKRVLTELRNKHGIVQAGSGVRRGIAALGDVETKRGKLPESVLVKQAWVLCAEEQADEIFDYIFWSAKLDKPGRGMIWQRAVTGCTPYELPAEIEDEESAS